ncbi:dihydrofolate reductase family protein [Paenibacillus sp. GCM10012306]|uniref:dihydrofolate reductase family protein n=1 Tax=Paenibacillus sp. GCM10012306 TaxID=3317342 RepID=UPI0036092D89
MRKVVLKMNVSLDGYISTPSGGVDWIFNSFDSGLEQYLVNLFWQADTHIMGRITYNMMSEHWQDSTEGYAAPMNEIPKVVFSRTLKEASWQNSRLVQGDLEEELAFLKRQPGKMILAHGGAGFAQSLMRLGLVDEYQLMIHPVVLGEGIPLFKDMHQAQPLKLLDTRVFDAGAVLHVYQPANSLKYHH